jgi:group I intron endonuclease
MEYPRILISGNYSVLDEFSGQGVYFASGLNTSESFVLNGYIGSTEDLNHRIRAGHISLLNSGKHQNPIFQKAWDKYGQDNFVWFQLEETTSGTQFQREQWYLDNWRPFADEGRGFNIAKDALNPPSHKGKKRSEEFKRKVSEAQSGENGYWYGVRGASHPIFGSKHKEESLMKMSSSRTGEKQTQEHKNKVSAALKGKKKTPEHNERVRLAHQTPFKVISPSGEVFHQKGRIKFCKEHGLSRVFFRRLLDKKIDSYKGWTRAPELNQ